MPESPEHAPTTSAALEFARGMHHEMHETNRDYLNRAQVVLTLNGVIIGLIASGLTSDPDDLRKALNAFSWHTWTLALTGGVALILSIVACVLLMATRYKKKTIELPEDPGYPTPIPAERMWFHRHVAEYLGESDRFVDRVEELGEADEIRTRASQALAMSGTVKRRGDLIKRAYALLAVALILFALAAADYALVLGA